MATAFGSRSGSQQLQDYFGLALELFLSVVLNLFTTETSRQRKSTASSNKSQDPNNNSNHVNDHNDDENLERSFQKFNLSLSEIKNNSSTEDLSETRTKLKKEWRTLSRMYHPDRNVENTREATEQMQTLNHAYDVCCKELDRLEGLEIDEPELSDENEEEEVFGDREKPRSSSSRRWQHPKAKAKRKQEKRDREFRRHQDREYKRQQREAEREFKRQQRAAQEEFKRQQRAAQEEFKREEREIKEEISRVRHAADASQNFAASVRQQEQQQQWGNPSHKNKHKRKKPVKNEFEQVPPVSPLHSSTVSRPPTPAEAHERWIFNLSYSNPGDKPPHYTLDNCTNPMAVAIRLGHKLMVHYFIDRKMEEFIAKLTLDMPLMKVLSMTHQVFLQVVMDPLDLDNNTLLHYVSFYERMDLLNFFLMQLGADYVEAFLKQNRRGQVPADFCFVANNQDFKLQIDNVTDAARKKEQDRRVWSQLIRAAKELFRILKWVDIFSVLHFALTVVVVGRILFQQPWWLSILISVLIPLFMFPATATIEGPEKWIVLTRPSLQEQQVMYLATHVTLRLFDILVATCCGQGLWARCLIPGLTLSIKSSRCMTLRAISTVSKILSCATNWLGLNCLCRSFSENLSSERQQCLLLIVYCLAWWLFSITVLPSFQSGGEAIGPASESSETVPTPTLV